MSRNVYYMYAGILNKYVLSDNNILLPNRV